MGQILLVEELARPEEDSQMQRTEISQPAIFAMQMALAELWKSWGVQPAAVVGHSVGEIAAACVAGILTLDQAAKIIVHRGRFMDQCSVPGGTMLAVGMSPEEAQAVIDRHDPAVSIAAFNGPRSLTLSGLRTSLEPIAAELEAQGVFARFLQVSHPFHHAMMQPAADALHAALGDLAPHAETIPFFSTVTGGRHRWHGLRCRPLVARRAGTGGLRRCDRRGGGIRCGCVAGNRCPPGFGAFDPGMPRRTAPPKLRFSHPSDASVNTNR